MDTKLKKYEHIKHLPGECFFKGRTVNTKYITDKEAEKLVKEGFPFLQLKAKETKVSDKKKTS